MGQVIAVVSGKGGTGKTSFTALVGSALAEMGHRTLCLDCDVGLRNLDLALGMSDSALMDFTDVIAGRATLEQAAVRHPYGCRLYLLTAPIGLHEDIRTSEMKRLLDEVRQKLGQIDVRSVSMSQESIAEAMMGKGQWWNPFPKVRYTERPDAATACVMEGNILVLVDNSPAAMILPTHFFDFVQEANDFYFPPLVGTYLRVLRVVVFLLTMFITPVWYLLVKDPSRTQAGLQFLAIDSDYSVPILAQLLLAEFIVDLLKLASLNTPDVFSNSFSMLGALVLGDFAVQAHWLVPEVLAYMAFVAISNFAQPSYELGYAFKLLRLMLLLFVGALDWVGLALGCIVIAAILASTKPIVGKGYLYPLCPFDKKALRALIIRKPISRENT